MFSLHMYIRVGQNFESAILMQQMKANVLLSREQVEKTVSCIPFFEHWNLKICQSCNFVVFGQIVLVFGTQIIRLIWTIFWIQFGQILHIFAVFDPITPKFCTWVIQNTRTIPLTEDNS